MKQTARTTSFKQTANKKKRDAKTKSYCMILF